jgi:hypothetical protein
VILFRAGNECGGEDTMIMVDDNDQSLHTHYLQAKVST